MNSTLYLNGKHPHLDLSQLEQVPGVRTFAAYVTPEIAKKMLERNTRNRKISEKVVAKYVQEILNDEWRLTPAGVGFDQDGTLVDGQHRLTAVSKSGRAVPMMFVIGLAPSSQEKVDRQRRRSLFDALFLSGMVRNRKFVEIATCLARRALSSNSANLPADSIVKQTLDCHKTSIEAICNFMGEKSVKGISQASFLAAAVLYHEIDAGRCIEFMQAIKSGAGLTQDHPALRLRKLLLGETALHSMPRGGANQSYIFCRAVYAMQAHLEGRSIPCLREAEDFTLAAVRRIKSPRLISPAGAGIRTIDSRAGRIQAITGRGFSVKATI